MDVPDLGPVFGSLQWAVAGAIAARFYMPERTTVDIDILVLAEDFGAAEQRLARAGWERTGAPTTGGSAWRSPEGVAPDLMSCEAPWGRAAVEEA